jgi:hypothetical protein
MSADKPAAAGDEIGHLLSDRFDELRISKKMSSLLGMNRADVKLRVGEEFRQPKRHLLPKAFHRLACGVGFGPLR